MPEHFPRLRYHAINVTTLSDAVCSEGALAEAILARISIWHIFLSPASRRDLSKFAVRSKVLSPRTIMAQAIRAFCWRARD